MPRPRERVCLQDGLKLDLNRLARKGFIKHGTNIGGRGITWTHSYWGEIATGTISADMSGTDGGWFRIQLGSLDQWITLVSRPRHFGGRQWYFMCPIMNRPASVLWKPSGATRFCSRQTWGRQDGRGGRPTIAMRTNMTVTKTCWTAVASRSRQNSWENNIV
jgi:hypothetical protein